MDGMLWQLVWINVVTPNFPFIFPLRVAITAGAVGALPWWAVLIIANSAGAVGMLPVYAIARWRAADQWHQRIERYPLLVRLRHRWRNNMLIVQVLMNATPLPDIVSSGLAGCERYPIWRFLLAQGIGRSFHNLPLVLGGLWLNQFGWFHRILGALAHPLTIIVGTVIVALWWLYHKNRQATSDLNPP